MTASLTDPEPASPARPWLRLAWLALPVFVLLFACGQLAVLTTPAAAPGQTGSALRADYSPWDFLAVQPVQAGLAEAALQDRQGPGAVLPSPRSGSSFQVTPPAGETAAAWQPLPSATPAASSSATPAGLEITPTQTVRFSPSPTPTGTPSPTVPVLPVLPSQTLTPPAPVPSATPTVPPSQTPTSRPSASLTPTAPTRAVTIRPSATATIHNLPTYTVTPSATASLTPSATPTPSPTLTPTHTSSPTATLTATLTLTPTLTFTPTFTATATDTPDPQLTPDLCSSSIPAGEPDLGPPDGEYAYLGCGVYYILDLGSAPVDASTADADPDVIYYERINPNQPDTIALDWVTFELGVRDANLGCNIPYWEKVFQWGDGDPANNGHLGASYPENDNQAVPLNSLSGAGSLQTGIAIDLNALGLNGIYGCARITSPVNWPDNDGAEIDAIQVLQP